MPRQKLFFEPKYSFTLKGIDATINGEKIKNLKNLSTINGMTVQKHTGKRQHQTVIFGGIQEGENVRMIRYSKKHGVIVRFMVIVGTLKNIVECPKKGLQFLIN